MGRNDFLIEEFQVFEMAVSFWKKGETEFFFLTFVIRQFLS